MLHGTLTLTYIHVHVAHKARKEAVANFYPQTTATSQLHPPPSSQQDLNSAPNPAATISISE